MFYPNPPLSYKGKGSTTNVCRAYITNIVRVTAQNKCHGGRTVLSKIMFNIMHANRNVYQSVRCKTYLTINYG